MGMATIPAVSKEMREMIDSQEDLKDCPQFILNCPISFDWVQYKGEDVFAGINYERSIKVRRPMIDIFYCATEAMCGNVLLTVQFNKKHFKPSRLATCSYTKDKK